MSEIAFWPVFVSSLITALIGWIWYHPKVFGSAWMRMSGITPEMAERGKRRMVPHVLVAFLGSMIIASAMNYFAIVSGVDNLASAIQLGFLCWVGFVASPSLGSVLWEQRPVRLYFINAGYWLTVFVVMSIVLFVGSQTSYDTLDSTDVGLESTAAVVQHRENLQTIQLGSQALWVYVADTPESRQRGLGGQSGLAPDEGMLFVFPQDGKYGFWMKDMSFAIDILWISVDKKVIHIVQNVSPSTYPERFEPPTPARFVLELSAGYVSKHRVQIGDIVRF